MYVDQEKSAPKQEESRIDLVSEVERLLEGVSGELRSQIVNSLIDPSISEAPEAGTAEDGLALSENARVILEQRYLRKDEDGNPTESAAELFRRVARAVAQGENEPVQTIWEKQVLRPADLSEVPSELAHARQRGYGTRLPLCVLCGHA